MNSWEILVKMVKEQGVEMVFGLGDSYLNMLAEEAGLLAVNVRHESAAPFMAMAYSRLSGNIGICSASAGPGTANLVPGVLEAYSGCSPLVIPCHSAAISTSGRGEFQECDQVALMEPITKWSAQIPKAELLPWYFKRSITLALNGVPGPVYLDLPHDVMGAGPLEANPADQGVESSSPEYPENFTRVEQQRIAADPTSVEQVFSALIKAEHPVVIFGNGAVLSRAFEESRQFVEEFELPFLTTPGGRGLISEDHPLALGLSGRYRTEPARNYYQKADLLITVGSKNEAFQTGYWQHFPERASFIQLDINPEAVGRNWQPDLALIGDVKTVMQQLLNQLNSQEKSREQQQQSEIKEKRAELRKELVEQKDKFQKKIFSESKTSRGLLAREIIPVANQVFGSETILVNENGSQDIWSYFYPYYQVESRLGCLPVAEQTCMGMGIVGAIAARLTCPERPVLCIAGDGAFQMYLQEMATAVQYNAGCTWLVLNNQGLGWIRAKQQRAGFSTYSTDFSFQPDLTAAAESFGCLGFKVTEMDQLRPALTSALEANAEGQPVLIDCEIEYNPDMSHLDDGRWWEG